jgi:hypothetical protein
LGLFFFCAENLVTKLANGRDGLDLILFFVWAENLADLIIGFFSV